MNNQYGKVIGTQSQTNETSRRYQIQLLSKDISGALKSDKLRRIGIIRIHPEQRSSPTHISIDPDINIGISTSQELLNEYRSDASIPDNIFGFESAGGKLQEIKQFFESRCNQSEFTEESNRYLVGMVLSVNERILRQTLHQKYPKRNDENGVIMRFHAHLVSNINFADCTRYGTTGNSSESDAVEQLGYAYFLMHESYGWKTEHWEAVLFDLIGALKHEFKSEYYAQEYRMKCFDEFVNYTLEEPEFFKKRTLQDGACAFPAYPGPYWPFVALRDLLSSKSIISKYLSDESKDIELRINTPHLQSLKWFLNVRLGDLGYQYVENRIKECAFDTDGEAARRFQQKMVRFIVQNIAGSS